MEELLRAHLCANPAVVAAVGTNIDWGLRNGAPSIALEIMAAPRGQTYAGPTGFVSYRIKGDCWGKSYGEAKRAARALIEALPRQDMTTRFRGNQVLGERDGTDEDHAGTPLHRTTIDFRILFQKGD